MPFVQRVISPVHISRSSRNTKRTYIAATTDPTSSLSVTCDLNGTKRTPQSINDNELETVTNLTLCNALRQLASLISHADEIFIELNKELRGITDRTDNIKLRITTLQHNVEDFDPKLVAVRKYILIVF